MSPSYDLLTPLATDVDLAAEASTRAAADNSLDSRVDTIEATYATDVEVAAAVVAAGTGDRDRANHTGTQVAATISDFVEAAQDALGSILADSATLDFTYDDASNTLTATIKAGSVTEGMLAFNVATQVELAAEQSAREVADNALDTRVDAIEAVDYGTQAELDAETAARVAGDAAAVQRANHTGTQTSGTISDFVEAAQDAMGALLADTATLDVTYNDAGNVATIDIKPASITTGMLAFDVATQAELDAAIVAAAAADRARANHTGTQLAATISDFTEAAQDAVGALLVDSSTIDVTYNDAGNAETFDIKAASITTAMLAFDVATQVELDAEAVARAAGDAAAVQRANHTGTQLASTISDFTEAAQDAAGALLADTSTLDVTYNDAGNVETIDIKAASVTTGMLAFDVATQAELDAALIANAAADRARANHTGTQLAATISDFTEAAQDAIGALLADSATLDFTYNDAGNVESAAVLDSPTVAGATPAQLRDRATHTGTQLAATVSDFTEAAQDAVGAMLADTATIDVTYNDAGNQATFDIKPLSISTGMLNFDVATQAELDAAYAAAIQRANHTGTILSSVVSDFVEAAQDATGLLLGDSNQIDVTYNDAGNTHSARVLTPVVAVTGVAAKVYTAADIGRYFRRSNGGAAMNDVLPTLTAADNGYAIKVQNLGTTIAETLTFTGAGGEVIGELAATSYVLNYGCRQTFVWDGARLAWSFDAGNGNLPKRATGVAAGDIMAVTDSTGLQLQKATSAQLAAVGNDRFGRVNILDYGADRTGVTSSRTALDNAIAALPNGGVVFFPPGTYNLGNTAYTLATAHITLRGATRYNTNIVTTSTTEDILVVGQYYNVIEDLTFIGPGSGENPTKTAGFGINTNTAAGGASTEIRRCTFFYQFSCINLASSLSNIDDVECKFFEGVGIEVNHNSDHQIENVIMNNNAAFPNTGGAGIRVKAAASLQMSNLNIISSWFALDLAPAAGVTVPSVKGVNCFFDTSVVGLNMTSGGSVFRSEFTNCWFSSMSTAGVRMQPAAGGAIDGVTFVNCDIYNNIAGTTVGVDTNTLTGKWKMVGCNIAGWTTGINLVAGTNHFPTILSNTIGSVSAFGVNTTGVVIGAGTFQGIMLLGNDVDGNTTAATIGAFVVPAGRASRFRIIDNAGINPKGSVGVIPLPGSTVQRINDTGYRVTIYLKASGVAAPTVITVNGVNIVLPPTNGNHSIMLDPGGTIQMTYASAPTWTWVAN